MKGRERKAKRAEHLGETERRRRKEQKERAKERVANATWDERLKKERAEAAERQRKYRERKGGNTTVDTLK